MQICALHAPVRMARGQNAQNCLSNASCLASISCAFVPPFRIVGAGCVFAHDVVGPDLSLSLSTAGGIRWLRGSGTVALVDTAHTIQSNITCVALLSACILRLSCQDVCVLDCMWRMGQVGTVRWMTG
jgi:hypothetical protein